MNRLLIGLIFVYVLALHCSIAAMEITSWTLFAATLVALWRARQKPDFPLALPLLLLVAVTGVSLGVNPPLRPFWEQFGFMRWFILLWGFYWALSRVWSADFERNLLRVWGVAMIITAAYAAFESFTGVDLIRPTATFENLGGVYRPTGFFTFTLTYGYMMGVSASSVFFPALERRVWPKWIGLFAVIGIWASMSRGVQLSFALVWLFAVLVHARRLLPVYVLANGLGFYLLTKVSWRMNDTLHLKMESSSMERTHLWTAYWHMFLDHPIWGIGLFQGDLLLPEYYEKLGIVEHINSHAHNVPLQWLAGTGVFGLLLWTILSLWFLWEAWRLRRFTPWGWSLLVAQLFWHLGGMTEANFFDGEVNHMIVFGWAILLVQRRRFSADPVRAAE